MSFSWRNLLGSNGAASSAAASHSAIGLGLPGAHWNAPSGVEGSWDEIQEARLLGMVNFGNTCYANSVLQALYFCKPFRDSMLAYIPPAPEPAKAAGQIVGADGSFVRDEPAELLIDAAPSPAHAQGSFPRRMPSSQAQNHLGRPGTADTAKQGDFGHKRKGSGTWGFSSRSGRAASKGSAPTSRNPSPTRSNAGGAADAKDGNASANGKAADEVAQPPKEPDSLFVTLRDLFNLISSEAATRPPPPAPVSGFGSLLHSSVGSANLGRKTSTRPTTAGGRLGGAPTSSAGLGAAPAPAQPHVLAANGSTSGGASAGGEADGTVDVNALKGFLGALKRENVLFNSTAHQDAHEFLNFILNRVGEDLVAMSRDEDQDVAPPLELKGEGSVVRPRMAGVKQVGKGGETCVHRLFEGTLTNETRCLTCETVTSRDESFLDLSIDIERNSSITSCLRQFSASEMLCSRNKFFCDTCSGLQEAEKRMKIKRLPNVLALHLKRFKYEEQLQRFVKLAYRVVFPLTLRLFNTSDDAEDPDRLYDLFAIVVHLGTGPHHGHYIAIVKVGRRWCVFDDENVTFIEEADISRYYGDTPGTGSAYVLFYQARELDFAGLGLPPQTPPTWAPPPPAAHRFASVSAAMAAEAGSSAAASPFSSSAPNGTDTAGVRVGGSPQAVPSGLPIPHSTASGSTTPAGGSGFFARRQNSVSETSPGATVAAAYSTSSNGGALTSSSGSSASGGWLSSLRGGRERRTTNSSVAASATTAESMYGSLTLPPPSAFKQPATLSAPHSTAPSSGPDTDDAASTHTSSTSASAVMRGRAAEAAHLGAPLRRGSSASPAQLPTTLVEEPSSLSSDSAPLSSMRSVPSLNGQSVNGSVRTDDRKSTAPVVTATSDATTPQSNGATLAPTPQTPTRSATMLPSVSGGASPYAGAAFLPADRPLSKKEQQKIAKTRRISGVPSVVNLPPMPADVVAPVTATTIKRRSTLGGRFGFGRNKD